MGFLRWIDAQPALQRYAWQQDKSAYLPDVMSAFPELRAEYDRSLARLAQTKAVRACFNGLVVAEITGLAGKSLGEFIAHFKRKQGDSIYSLPMLSADRIRELIRVEFQQYESAKAQSSSPDIGL